MTVAALMVLSTIVCLIGLLVDQRQVTGLDVWTKPLKFSLSILLYSVTWAWLIAHLPRWRRVAHAAGTVIAVALIVEQVLIVAAAAAGTTSHFNVSTPLASAIWATMAVSITTPVRRHVPDHDRRLLPAARHPLDDDRRAGRGGHRAGRDGARLPDDRTDGRTARRLPRHRRCAHRRAGRRRPGPAGARLEHGRRRPPHPALRGDARAAAAAVVRGASRLAGATVAPARRRPGADASRRRGDGRLRGRGRPGHRAGPRRPVHRPPRRRVPRGGWILAAAARARCRARPHPPPRPRSALAPSSPPTSRPSSAGGGGG